MGHRGIWSTPALAAAATIISAVLAAPAVHAAPFGSSGSSGTGSLGSLECLGTGSLGAGSSDTGSLAPGGIANPIPWLNGHSGGLPNLRGTTSAIERITGLRSPNDTVARFNVLGTDLGIMWDNGKGQVLTAFGDTVGLSNNPLCQGLIGDWRSNVLLRSDDHDLTNGMSIANAATDRPNHAKEIIPSEKIPGIETTVIPTSGISVGQRQYLDFMSVRSWGAPGEWVTNYSGIAYSDDNGENWTVDPQTYRSNDPVTGNAHFQMGAFVRPHDPDGFIYEFGTPPGRGGAAYLSRVPDDRILDLNAYEYWNGKSWTPAEATPLAALAEAVPPLGTAPASAVPVIPAPVSEMSVRWNDYLGKYIMLYTDAGNSLVMRTSAKLEGPWSAPKTLISSAQVPGLYGAYIHPWSSGQDLYFLATTWSDYNVMLMRTTLAK